MKRLFASLPIVLLALACCCKGEEGGGGPVTPVDPDPVVPELTRPTLMQVFETQIEKQKDGTPRDRIFLVAHRANTYYGYLNAVPDNSIPGIELAIKYGADMVELDVRPTKDNVLVLMHNETIDASTTGKGKLSSYTYEELMQFDMKKNGKVYKDADGNPVKVPTLEQALDACKDKVYINLDVKDASPSKLCKLVKRHEMEDQVMIYTGSSVSTATEYQYANVNIPVHPYISKASDVGGFSALPGAKLFQYGYDLYGEGKNPEIGRQVRALGFLSYSNLLNYDNQVANSNFTKLDAFIDSESDFLQTDFVEIVHNYLKQKGLR